MDIYLANISSRKEIRELYEALNIFIAGPHADYDNVWQKNKGTPEEAMKIYLSVGDGGTSAAYKDHDTLSGEFLNEKAMKIYLAGCFPCDETQKGSIAQQICDGDKRKVNRISILESFYYIKDWMIPYINDYWNFLLDSGAYTFMTGKNNGDGIDWNSYVDRYADFINAHEVDLFFELDIDNVVGLQKVEQLRARLEKRTGKQPIPVWHKSRGKQKFFDMCQEYSYVALGGIVAREFSRKEHTFFPWFIDKAHEHGAKIHGLGFTRLQELSKYHFDSVDSTAWVFGNISGKVYSFNGTTLISRDTLPGQRIKTKETAIHNFREWVKYQKYAEVHL